MLFSVAGSRYESKPQAGAGPADGPRPGEAGAGDRQDLPRPSRRQGSFFPGNPRTFGYGPERQVADPAGCNKGKIALQLPNLRRCRLIGFARAFRLRRPLVDSRQPGTVRDSKLTVTHDSRMIRVWWVAINYSFEWRIQPRRFRSGLTPPLNKQADTSGTGVSVGGPSTSPVRGTRRPIGSCDARESGVPSLSMTIYLRRQAMVASPKTQLASPARRDTYLSWQSNKERCTRHLL